MLATPEDLVDLNRKASSVLGRTVKALILGDTYAWHVDGRFFVYDVEDNCFHLVYPKLGVIGPTGYFETSWSVVPNRIEEPTDIPSAITWLGLQVYQLAPDDGPVTPLMLRTAANDVIRHGREGSPLIRRYAGQTWSDRLIKTFIDNEAELLEICTQLPPNTEPVIRLLELCRDISNGALIDATIALP